MATISNNLELDLPGEHGERFYPWALATSAIILVFAIGIVAFGDIQLVAIPQFVLLHATFVFLLGVITAFMLYGQFFYRRLLLYLILGNGYLFTSLISIPFLLSFPGVFLQTGSGLIGGSQSAIWMWHYWHILFPVFVIAALLVHHYRHGKAVTASRIWPLVLSSVAALVVLVSILTASITLGHDALPVLIDVGQTPPLTSLFYWIGWLAAGLAVIGLILSWRQGTRQKTVMLLWLTVAMSGFVADDLASLGAYQRYTVGWYFGRIESLIASSALLMVFISELNNLYRGKEELNRSLQSALNEIKTLRGIIPICSYCHKIRNDKGA